MLFYVILSHIIAMSTQLGSVTTMINHITHIQFEYFETRHLETIPPLSLMLTNSKLNQWLSIIITTISIIEIN